MVRFCDLLLASTALVILSPILLPIVIMLRLTGEGEVFYIQTRIGRNGDMFGLIKFATMLKDSPNIGTGTITIKDDPRVLRLGRVLRKTKINELPQLINVVLGDMSIIGPRPVTKEHFYLYPENCRKKISTVRPGLSGIGSIVFRDEERLLSMQENPIKYYAVEIAPYKGSLEAWFVDRVGLALYFKCILLTIVAVLFPSVRMVYKTISELPLPQGQLRLDLKIDN